MIKKVCFALILVSLLLLPSGFYPAVTSGRAASGVMLGIYPNGSIGTGNHEITLLDAYFGANRVSLAGGFVDWETNTSHIRSELDYAWNNGYWPVLNIGAGNVADPSCTNDVCTAARIAGGQLDSAITAWAQEFKDWTAGGTKKAYLAPLQEMNGDWVDYFGDPTNYIAAYLHIQDIFLNDVGVDPNSVVWVFAPNGWSDIGDPGFEAYYPGDAAVDVVGFSSFNWGTCFTGTTWETYNQIYKPYLDRMAAMAAPGTPIWIMEMASHTEGGDRDAWFDEALTNVANYSGVEAVMYFNRAEDPHSPYLLPACDVGAGIIDYGLDYDSAEGKARFKTEILQAPYVFSSPTSPEIDLQGNSQSIINGDPTPSTADHTDFGSVDVSSGSVAYTFVVENTGTANLFLTGTTMVEISGANAADFTVTIAPSSWFVALDGGTESFEITFDPSAKGIRTALVTITNDDNDEYPYTFAIQGTGMPPPDIDSIGFWNPNKSKWYLKYENSGGDADNVFKFGPVGLGWTPITGDWNDNGVDTIGYWNPNKSKWYLKNSNSAGEADIVFVFGPVGVGWEPITGDWDGNGSDTIGFYNPNKSKWILKNSNSSGEADHEFYFGPVGVGWEPIVGDWDGDGDDTIGFYNPNKSKWYLKNSNSKGDADVVFAFGPVGVGWEPITGNWDGDNNDTIGFYNPIKSKWYLKNNNSSGDPDVVFVFGPVGVGWEPITGNWQ